MEIRRIRPEEKISAELIMNVVFLFPAEENYRQRLENPADAEQAEGYEQFWAAFGDDGKMTSCLVVNEYQTRFDGHTVGMGGVGGVGTLPEYRKGGHIRKIFEKALPEMREEGKVFSFLYPFSFAFYRKFGYELCRTYNRVTLPVKLFQTFPYPDRVEFFQKGGDAAPYAKVYEVFARDKNLAVVRTEKGWKNILDMDPYIKRQYTYLYRDASGEPAAYVIFSAEKDDDGNLMAIRELAWVNPAAFFAMLGFLGGLAPQFGNAQWNMPSAFDITSLFPESHEIKITRPVGGMNRIVNVPQALSLLRAPEKEGRAVIKVTDKFLPANDGVYKIEWDGSGSLFAKTSGRTPDMETDVETLTQLVTGFLTLEQARYRKNIVVDRNEKPLRALFPHKDLYLMEYF